MPNFFSPRFWLLQAGREHPVRCAAFVDNEIGMLWADDSTTDMFAFKPGRFDQPSGFIIGWIAEN